MGLRKQQTIEPPAAPWFGARWEYRVIEVGGRSADKMDAQLNAAGAQGWELVGVAAPQKGQMGSFSTTSLVGILKRPIGR